ncbi:MAG: hypothetical protein KDA28_15505, partial [Phycisphaerales bacterium]|nr:hypothetical protein [Phycisphaerales bacterium]
LTIATIVMFVVWLLAAIGLVFAVRPVQPGTGLTQTSGPAPTEEVDQDMADEAAAAPDAGDDVIQSDPVETEVPVVDDGSTPPATPDETTSETDTGDAAGTETGSDTNGPAGEGDSTGAGGG